MDQKPKNEGQPKSRWEKLKESGRTLVSETGKKLRKAGQAVKEVADEALPSMDRRVWSLGYEKDATPEETARFKAAEAAGDEKTMGQLKDAVDKRRKR